MLKVWLYLFVWYCTRKLFKKKKYFDLCQGHNLSDLELEQRKSDMKSTHGSMANNSFTRPRLGPLHPPGSLVSLQNLAPNPPPATNAFVPVCVTLLWLLNYFLLYIWWLKSLEAPRGYGLGEGGMNEQRAERAKEKGEGEERRVFFFVFEENGD